MSMSADKGVGWCSSQSSCYNSDDEYNSDGSEVTNSDSSNSLQKGCSSKGNKETDDQKKDIASDKDNYSEPGEESESEISDEDDVDKELSDGIGYHNEDGQAMLGQHTETREGENSSQSDESVEKDQICSSGVDEAETKEEKDDIAGQPEFCENEFESDNDPKDTRTIGRNKRSTLCDRPIIKEVGGQVESIHEKSSAGMEREITGPSANTNLDNRTEKSPDLSRLEAAFCKMQPNFDEMEEETTCTDYFIDTEKSRGTAASCNEKSQPVDRKMIDKHGNVHSMPGSKERGGPPCRKPEKYMPAMDRSNKHRANLKCDWISKDRKASDFKKSSREPLVTLSMKKTRMLTVQHISPLLKQSQRANLWREGSNPHQKASGERIRRSMDSFPVKETKHQHRSTGPTSQCLSLQTAKDLTENKSHPLASPVKSKSTHCSQECPETQTEKPEEMPQRWFFDEEAGDSKLSLKGLKPSKRSNSKILTMKEFEKVWADRRINQDIKRVQKTKHTVDCHMDSKIMDRHGTSQRYKRTQQNYSSLMALENLKLFKILKGQQSLYSRDEQLKEYQKYYSAMMGRKKNSPRNIKGEGSFAGASGREAVHEETSHIGEPVGAWL